jgi:4-amino-4-deoxy-L-arabinose transferase-like glycosyltransferase
VTLPYWFYAGSVVGIAAGFLLTPGRRYFRSPWLWCGIALAFMIFLPNLLWQVRHDFVSLDFLRSIHARDIRMGRTDNFIIGQFCSLPARSSASAGRVGCLRRAPWQFESAFGSPLRLGD